MEDYLKILIAVFICFFIVWTAKYYFEYKHSIKKANEQTDKKSEEQSEEQSEELKEKLTDVNYDEPKFIKSEWIGSKPGYVFYRSGEYGTGYHLDNYKKNEKGEWVLK